MLPTIAAATPNHAHLACVHPRVQFWGLKRQAMDLVLFVRHGSFYNLFDCDADVGLRVGLNLSGKRTPNMWKVRGMGGGVHSRGGCEEGQGSWSNEWLQYTAAWVK